MVFFHNTHEGQELTLVNYYTRIYVLIATLQYSLIPLILPKYNNNVRMKECVIYLRRSSQNETMSE